MASGGPEPGWYLDPEGPPDRERYWNGVEWTDHRRPSSTPLAAGGVKPVPIWLAVPKWLQFTLLLALLAVFVIGVVWFLKAGSHQISDSQNAVYQACIHQENFTGLKPDSVEKCKKEAGIK